MSLYDRLFKPRRYTLPNGTVVEERRSRAPLVILIVLALGALSVHITGFDFAVLVKKGGKFFDILTAMFPPNTGYLAKIWQPLWDTVKMSFLGSFVGAVLAIPFAIAAASNIVHKSRGGVHRPAVPQPGAHAAHAGVRADRHLYLRPGHHGRYLRHRRVHLCLCGQAAFRDHRNGGHGPL